MDAKIIPLIGHCSAAFEPEGRDMFVPASMTKPWAPFRTLADFEYTETAIQGLLSKELVDRQLAGFHKGWHTGETCLTISNYGDMQESLYKARAYVVQVCVLLFRIYALQNLLQLSLGMIKCLLYIMEKHMNMNFSIEIHGSIF